MDASSAPSALAAALDAALALSPADQSRLCALLQRLTAATPDGTHDPLADTELATSIAPGPQAEVDAWLQDIAPQPAWLRLQLLEDAIEACDTDAQRATLQAAHAQLLQSHPPLAVRRTVTELATVHPVSTGIAVVGLLLGLAGFARAVLRGLF